MSYRSVTDFLLYDWLDVESLCTRTRFADHSRGTFDAVLDMCEKLAAEKFAPFNRVADTEEPWFDGERVHLPESSHAAARAYVESGMLAAAQDAEIGGMQLPCVVEMAAQRLLLEGRHRHRRRRHADERQRQPADGARQRSAEARSSRTTSSRAASSARCA